MENQSGRIVLSELTTPECRFFTENCNFTAEEQQVFDLRIKNKSVVQISFESGLSTRTVDRRIKSIKRKIYKII